MIENKNEPTPEDMELNLAAKLMETNIGIATLKEMDIPVPNEAYEIRAILRRAVWAEGQLNG